MWIFTLEFPKGFTKPPHRTSVGVHQTPIYRYGSIDKDHPAVEVDTAVDRCFLWCPPKEIRIHHRNP